MVTSGKLNAGQGFAIEYVITFALVLVVYAAACDDFNAPNVKGSAPLAIGLAIAIGHLFAVCVVPFIFLPSFFYLICNKNLSLLFELQRGE